MFFLRNYYKTCQKFIRILKEKEDLKYYVQTECDSNGNEFEELSNSNRIVFKTTLDPELAELCLEMLHAVYMEI